MTERLPQSCIAFTEREKLYDQVSHQRLLEILHRATIDIHEVKEGTNSFGEYLFVTISCRDDQPRKPITFYGLGYHEYREHWIADKWQWFESQRKITTLPTLPKEEALRQIAEREVFVRSQIAPSAPSKRAQLYDLLADMTDEDGALAELDDLSWTIFGATEDE